jgi:phosphatidylserine/phosphatidylglycerophosphate/cardiolipin synthase-like enzyme
MLVSSANLTSSALERNMELGVVVTGGSAPSRIGRHFRDLIQRGILEEVSAD